MSKEQHQQQHPAQSEGCAGQTVLEMPVAGVSSRHLAQLRGLPLAKAQWESAWSPLSPRLIPNWAAPGVAGTAAQQRQCPWPRQQQLDGLIGLEQQQSYGHTKHLHQPQEQEQQQEQEQAVICQVLQQRQLPNSWAEYYVARQLPSESPAGE